MVSTEVVPVSSTIVRQSILTLRQIDSHSPDYETHIRKMVEDRLLPRNAIDYIMALSEKDLYHPPLEKKQTKQKLSNVDSEDE